MPGIGEINGGGVITEPVPVPDVTAASTKTGKRGQCRVHGYPPFPLSRRGNNAIRRHFVGVKRGRQNVLHHFVGTKKGRAGVSFNSFVGKKRGRQRVLNHFTGKKHGLSGVALLLIGTKRGHNTIHWFFGGSDHKGRAVVSAPVLVLNHYEGQERGKNRIANAAIEGYVVWVGSNVPADVNSDPDDFSPTLPMYVLSALPSTGGVACSNTGDIICYDDVGDIVYMCDEDPFGTEITEERIIHVVVRKRDQYGLVSQNQMSKQFVLRPAGGLLPPIAIPKSFTLTVRIDNSIQVRAVYPNALTDEFPATHWGIWISLNSPADTSLPPSVVVPVKAQLLNTVVGPKNPGRYYVSIALFRLTDGAWSNVLTLPVTLPYPPLCPVPVPSGYQLECDCSTQHPVPLDAVAFTSSEELIDIGGGSLSSHD